MGGAGGRTSGQGGHASGGIQGSGGAAGAGHTGSGGAGGQLSTGGAGGGAAGAAVVSTGGAGGGGTGTGGAVSTGGGGHGGGGTGTGGAVSTGVGGHGGGGGTSSAGGAAGGPAGTGGTASTAAGGSSAAGTNGTGGGAAGSGAAGAAGTGGTGAAANCGAAQTLVDSTNSLIDLFVVNDGVIVVDDSTVSLIGRDAKVIKSVPFARQITAAAFDGTTLVIADAAELTVMSPALDVGPTAFLVASCADAVLVGGNHFVCGPNTDTDRVYDTYDVTTNPPIHVAASSSYTYDGVTMFRVPGTSAFVTVTLYLSPASFSLFQVAADTGLTTWVGSSPFDTYASTQIVAFDGTPATHMIQQQGDILGVSGSACQGGIYGCFAQTGVLGTLRSGQSYVGLGDDGAGRIVALVSSDTTAGPFGAPCANGCPLQLIDIPTRTILQQQTYTIADLSTVVRATYDPGCQTAVLGYIKATAAGSTGTAGYRVQELLF